MKRPTFYSGNVVEWDKSLWIVKDDVVKPSSNENYVVLMSFHYQAFTAHPSDKWPYIKAYADDDGPADHRPDPTRTVDTIRLVADSVSTFIDKRFRAVFGI